MLVICRIIWQNKATGATAKRQVNGQEQKEWATNDHELERGIAGIQFDRGNRSGESA